MFHFGAWALKDLSKLPQFSSHIYLVILPLYFNLIFYFVSIIDNAVRLFLIISCLQLYITLKSDAALLRRLPNLSVPMLFLRNKGEST